MAHRIYRRLRAEHGLVPDEEIMTLLFVVCIQRGSLDVASKLFSEFLSDGLLIPKRAISKLYDLCSIKHSMYFADVVTKEVLSHRLLRHVVDGDVLNHYLRICGVCGHLAKALAATERFARRDVAVPMDLVSLHLLLRTLTANAQIHDEHRGRRAWKGVMARNYNLYCDRLVDAEANPPWHRVLGGAGGTGTAARLQRPSSLQLLLRYEWLLEEHRDSGHLVGIMDQIAFFAARFETARHFVDIYKCLLWCSLDRGFNRMVLLNTKNLQSLAVSQWLNC